MELPTAIRPTRPKDAKCDFGQDVASTECVEHDRSGWPAPAHSGVDGLGGRRVPPQVRTATHHSTAAHRGSRCSCATTQSGRAD